MKLAAQGRPGTFKWIVDALHLDGRRDLAGNDRGDRPRADGRHTANALGLEGLAVSVAGLVGVVSVDDTAAVAPGIVRGATTATAVLDELLALHGVAPVDSGPSGLRIRRIYPIRGPVARKFRGSNPLIFCHLRMKRYLKRKLFGLAKPRNVC